MDKPFELVVKPYTDRALAAMRHREDKKRTGTYVTLQAFQPGIGTGACGPAIAKEHQFDARKEYELKFILSVEYKWYIGDSPQCTVLRAIAKKLSREKSVRPFTGFRQSVVRPAVFLTKSSDCYNWKMPALCKKSFFLCMTSGKPECYAHSAKSAAQAAVQIHTSLRTG